MEDGIRKIVEMFNAGHQIREISEETGVPLQTIDENLSEWVASVNSERYISTAATSLTPSERLMEVMPKAVKSLEGNDVEAFFEKVAPLAAMQMAKDAVMASDAKIRHAAQKDILDRAGFKPKAQVEVFNKYDKLNRDELVASIRSALLENPKSVEILKLKAMSDDPDTFAIEDSGEELLDDSES